MELRWSSHNTSKQHYLLKLTNATVWESVDNLQEKWCLNPYLYILKIFGSNAEKFGYQIQDILYGNGGFAQKYAPLLRLG